MRIGFVGGAVPRRDRAGETVIIAWRCACGELACCSARSLTALEVLRCPSCQASRTVTDDDLGEWRGKVFFMLPKDSPPASHTKPPLGPWRVLEGCKCERCESARRVLS